MYIIQLSMNNYTVQLYCKKQIKYYISSFILIFVNYSHNFHLQKTTPQVTGPSSQRPQHPERPLAGPVDPQAPLGNKVPWTYGGGVAR